MSDTPTRREPEATRTITCVWCGYACPAGTPTAHDQRLREHVKVCPKHPLANVIRACELAESIDRENGVTMIGHPDKGRGQMLASDVLKLAFGEMTAEEFGATRRRIQTKASEVTDAIMARVRERRGVRANG
jgi:hypothetical protein